MLYYYKSFVCIDIDRARYKNINKILCGIIVLNIVACRYYKAKHTNSINVCLYCYSTVT